MDMLAGLSRCGIRRMRPVFAPRSPADPLGQAAPLPLQNCTDFAACPFLPTPQRDIFEPPLLNENRILWHRS
jgi:hypothetical protein